MAFWYSLLSFGIFFTFWYVWTKKNLATRNGYDKAIIFSAAACVGQFYTWISFFAEINAKTEL
jgi:hypothetical protein